MFKLHGKFDADLLLYSLSYFECYGHTVHMLTQWHLPPQLPSRVKLLLFMHMHFQPTLLGCHINIAQTILIILTMDRPCGYVYGFLSDDFLSIRSDLVTNQHTKIYYSGF